LRGIELPYRTSWEHGKRALGLAAAVERAVGNGRPDVVILFSDLAGFAEDDHRAIRAIARLRKAAGSVVVLTRHRRVPARRGVAPRPPRARADGA